MVASLNDFISNIKKNSLARTNRFVVDISPSKKYAGHNENAQLVQLFCEQAVLPGVSFASQPVKTYGESREVVYDRNYESVSLTFLVDRKMLVKDYFDKWTYEIINPNTRLVGYYDSYVRDITITMQDTKDKHVYLMVLREAYPKTVSAVQLDNNSKEIMKLQVTFNYKFHTQTLVPNSEESVKSQFGFDLPDPYKLSTAAGQFIRDKVKSALDIPSEYFSNFTQYQKTANSSAIPSLERQGQQTGTGIPSDLNDFYG